MPLNSGTAQIWHCCHFPVGKDLIYTKRQNSLLTESSEVAVLSPRSWHGKRRSPSRFLVFQRISEGQVETFGRDADEWDFVGPDGTKPCWSDRAGVEELGWIETQPQPTAPARSREQRSPLPPTHPSSSSLLSLLLLLWLLFIVALVLGWFWR